MASGNQTFYTKFILVGFSDLPQQMQYLVMIVFLILYLSTVLGNVTILLLVTVDSALQSPMYFFLKNLSIVEIGFITTTVPNMLYGFFTGDRGISLLACAAQMYIFLMFGATECFLLLLMSYDRYMAICKPLRYTQIMTQQRCLQLAATAWSTCVVMQFVQTSLIFISPFCVSSTIPHYFCDISPVLQLSCSDVSLNNMLMFAASAVFLLIPFLVTILSYVFIITTILKIRSEAGRRRAFSTCASHLTSVTLFFGTAMLNYLRPSSNYSLQKDRVFVLCFNFVTPVLNPVIYSLRNSEVKGALKRQIEKLRAIYF
ncbi:olfactory receptor 10C1-like [Ambystoma mexicanum]|uniref:olfactory receptor 10C1-like n=1 Tax=Ambystoma mexicanum TaxID=8296 RepID=UPI0037E7A472